MVTVQSRLITIGLCIMGAIWLLVAQTIGSTWLLWPCLICFLAFIAWSALQGMALPVLLFFLPFAALLKLRPGMISFFTIALLIVYAVCTVRGIKNVSITYMVPGIALLVLTLVVKTLYGESVDNGFVLFFASILLIPFFKRELNEEKYDFYYLTVCFTAGIAIAAIAARYLIVFSTIRQYIGLLEYSGLVRYSGFYGDPNFYSAHITAALSGILVLMLNTSKWRRQAWLMVMAVLMVYCGSLGVSKSFLLVSIALFLIWIFALMFQKGKFTAKVTILMSLLVGATFLLASTVFTDQLAMLFSRLSRENSSLSDFTTGRIKLWGWYFAAFIEDARLLFFGRGLSDILVNDRGSHNIFVQCIYQFGILGMVFVGSWFLCCMRTLLQESSIKWERFPQHLVILIGAFGPWLGLDMLFFDEFFLLPIYVCVGISGNFFGNEKVAYKEMENAQSNATEGYVGGG